MPPSTFEQWIAGLTPWVPVLVALLLLVVGFWVGIRAARWVLRHRAGRTRRTGRRGEARALRLLERSGFRLVETQVAATGEVEVDGVLETYAVRADAVVGRRGRTYVAEFKGGAGSAHPTHRDTRRQLLEYALLFEADGLLLVDADRDRIHEVRFPGIG